MAWFREQKLKAYRTMKGIGIEIVSTLEDEREAQKMLLEKHGPWAWRERIPMLEPQRDHESFHGFVAELAFKRTFSLEEPKEIGYDCLRGDLKIEIKYASYKPKNLEDQIYLKLDPSEYVEGFKANLYVLLWSPLFKERSRFYVLSCYRELGGELEILKEGPQERFKFKVLGYAFQEDLRRAMEDESFFDFGKMKKVKLCVSQNALRKNKRELLRLL